jgi:hypothetical protein
MASGDLWKRKVQAFLYTPPHGALADDPKTVRRWAEELVRAALGEDARWEEEIEGADRIARGLDIPPFVEGAPAGVFWEDPCLTHPLSGKLYPLKELKDRLSGLDLQKIHESVVEAVKAIRREVEGVGSGTPWRNASSWPCGESFRMSWRRRSRPWVPSGTCCRPTPASRPTPSGIMPPSHRPSPVRYPSPPSSS